MAYQEIEISAVRAEWFEAGSTDFRAGLPPPVLPADHLRIQRLIDTSPGTHPTFGSFDYDPVAGYDLARRRRRRMKVNLGIERPAPQAR